MAPSASIPRWLWGAVVALLLVLPAPASAGMIGGQVRSLLAEASDKALARLAEPGAFSQMGKVAATASLPAAAGLSREGLTDSVTDQALDGMFKYIADEEEALREDPISAAFKGF